MIGIYKIQNKLNQKIYIGQSVNIERRFREHCNPAKAKTSGSPIDYAINKTGKENFTFEVIEECAQEELNDRETYWIKYYKSYPKGYNCNYGGKSQCVGPYNGRAKLSEEDVIEIRTAYNNHLRQRDVYEKYKDKITWYSFQSVWQGQCWSNIMPEVFTEENKNYYVYKNSVGEKSAKALLTDEEVANYRYRYQFETARDMYPEVSDKMKYQTFQRILCDGSLYSSVPIYGKAEKYILTNEEVKVSRQFYVNHSARQTYNNFDFAKNMPFSTFKQMLEGLRYTHLPWYSKKYKEWKS